MTTASATLRAIQPSPGVDGQRIAAEAAALTHKTDLAGRDVPAYFDRIFSGKGHRSIGEHWRVVARLPWGDDLLPTLMNQPFTDWTSDNICAEVSTNYRTQWGRVLLDARRADLVTDWHDLEIQEVHATATFDIRCSRAVSHQLVRHRSLSPTQESLRHVQPAVDGPDWAIMPDEIRDNPDARALMVMKTQMDAATYRALRGLGISKQSARYVLPIGTATRLYVTGTFQWWRYYLGLRTDKTAMPEHRELAFQIEAQLREVAPEVFE